MPDSNHFQEGLKNMLCKLKFESEIVSYSYNNQVRYVLYFYGAINDYMFVKNSVIYWKETELSFAKRYNKRWN